MTSTPLLDYRADPRWAQLDAAHQQAIATATAARHVVGALEDDLSAARAEVEACQVQQLAGLAPASTVKAATEAAAKLEQQLRKAQGQLTEADLAVRLRSQAALALETALIPTVIDALEEAYQASVARTAEALKALVEAHEDMTRLQRLAFSQFPDPPYKPGHVRVKAAAGLPHLALDPVHEGFWGIQPERQAFRDYAERWLKRAGQVLD